MELPEVPRAENTDKQRAQAASGNLAPGSRIKIADVQNERIRNGGIKETPKHIDCGRGQAFARRFREGTLEGAPHDAGNKMRNGVGGKNAAEKAGDKSEPIHGLIRMHQAIGMN